jgi:hypothetical protein
VDYLDGGWAEILGLIIVLGGVAVFACRLVVTKWRSARRCQQMAARLDREREWQLVMHRATKELARGPKVAELQADATVTIEAAEYAYNRLLRDCARHYTAPSAPTVEPTREVAREPEEAPAEERAPLAA